MELEFGTSVRHKVPSASLEECYSLGFKSAAGGCSSSPEGTFCACSGKHYRFCLSRSIARRRLVCIRLIACARKPISSLDGILIFILRSPRLMRSATSVNFLMGETTAFAEIHAINNTSIIVTISKVVANFCIRFNQENL